MALGIGALLALAGFSSGMGLLQTGANAVTSMATKKWEKEHIYNELNGAQREQNQWNADEAQKAREWNAEQDNTKYQRQVVDMQAAGVNPALAMSGGVSTQAASNAVASGSSQASYQGTQAADISSIMQMVSQLKLQNAQADKAEEEAHNLRIKNTIDEITGLEKSKAEIRNSNADSDVKERQLAQIEAEIALKRAQANLTDKQAAVQEKTAEQLAISNSNLDSLQKADLALKVAEGNLKQAELESYDWNNAKQVSLSEAQSMARAAGCNINVLGNGVGGNGSGSDMDSKTQMGYLIFNRKSKTYTFINGSAYFESSSSRSNGEGGSTSESGGKNASGYSHGGGGR